MRKHNRTTSCYTTRATSYSYGKQTICLTFTRLANRPNTQNDEESLQDGRNEKTERGRGQRENKWTQRNTSSNTKTSNDTPSSKARHHFQSLIYHIVNEKREKSCRRAFTCRRAANLGRASREQWFPTTRAAKRFENEPTSKRDEIVIQFP